MEIKELAKFIEEAVTDLRNGGEGTWYKQLGGKLYCVIGAYEDDTILGKIAVNSDDLQSDYDWDWTMPYHEDNGDVWDTEVEISDNDWEMYARDFLTQYEELSKIHIASDGRILEVPESDYYTLTYYYGDMYDLDNSDTETYFTWEETKSAFESQENRKRVKALEVRDEDDNVVKVWKAVGENKKPRKQRKLTENMDSLERLFVDFLNSSYYVDKTDDYFTYTFYADYRDTLSAEEVAEILESDSPLDAFYEKLNDAYIDSDDYAHKEIEKGFKDYLKSHNAEISDEQFEDRFTDMLFDYVSFTPDYNHFLKQDFKCRIDIDTGDSNYDYTLNPSYANDNIGASPEVKEEGIAKPASLVWLAETQGYSLEQLRKALAEGDIKDPQGFLQSVRQEAQNMSCRSAQLVFLCTASLSELLDWHTNKTALTVPSDIDCGLFDKWDGGGSVLEIQLDKPITIPAEYIRDFTPDVSVHYTYSVNDVYGLTAECYRARVKQETGTQETIKESIWRDDPDTDNIKHLSKEQLEIISDNLLLNDDEIVVDAYYLDKQLHIIIDDGDCETDYIPSGDVGGIEATLKESLLQDLHDDHEHIRKVYGQEVYDALDEYVALGNDLGNVMYNEEKWDEFEAWLRKEKGIEPKVITTESAVNGAFYGRQDIRNITVEPGYHEWVLKVDGKDYYSFGDITSQFENETNPDKASDIAADMIDAFLELEEQYYNDENAEDTFSFFEGAKEIGALCADEVDSARVQLDNVLRDYLSGGLLLSEAKKTKKPFNPTKLLKEGAGAGYHIEGKLSDIKLNSIKSVETFEGKSAFGTDLTFAKLIVDADAVVDGNANSYYYGGAINNAKVKITSFEVNPNLLYHIGLDEFEYNLVRDEDFQDRIGYGSEIAFKSKTIGGGWSHIDFDGTVEASIDDDYHSYLDGVEFYFVNKGDTEYINHVVQHGEWEDLEEETNEVDEFVQLLHSEIDNLRELGHSIKEPDEAMVKQLADELEKESVNCEYNDELTDYAVSLILQNLADNDEEEYDNDMGTFGESYLKEGYYDDEPDHFTPEEQEEYGIDEEGNSLDTYDRFRHCAFCGDVVAEYKKELDMGYLCHNCVDAIKSRGEKLRFEESFDPDVDLPDTVVVNINELNYNADEDDLSDAIGDYLSDRYGYCHFGFEIYDTDHMSGDIVVTNIEWDVSENLKESIEPTRKCSECGKGMEQGYVVDDGHQYFCSDECLHKHYTEEQVSKMFNNATIGNVNDPEYDLEHGQVYWTEFDLEESVDTANTNIYRHTNTNKNPLKPATFTIDDTRPFEGYNEEYSWNGWACPWFTKEAGDAIVDYYKDYMHFDAENDAFAYISPNDEEPDYFVGEDINTVDGVKHLYPIGNKGWTWDLVDEASEELTEDLSLEDMVREKITNLPIGKELVIKQANGILTNNKLHIKRLSDNKFELLNTGFNGDEPVISGHNLHSTLDNAVYWALSSFVRFENEPINESSQNQSKGLSDGDTFEYGGLSFTLWYLDGYEDEYAIVCDDIENDYDNTPVYVGFIKKDISRNDVMKEIESKFNGVVALVGEGCHYSEHYLNSQGIESSDDIKGKIKFVVEIQPDTEQETFGNYDRAFDYYNARVRDYKEESRNDDVSVALHKVVDDTIVDTLEYWKKDEALEEAWTTFEFEEGNPYIAKTEEEKQRLLKKYGDKVTEIKPGFYKVNNKATDNFAIEESMQPIDLVKAMKEDPNVTEYIAHSGKKCYSVTAPLQWYFLMCSRAGLEPKWTGDLTYEAKGDGFEFEWVEEDVILALDN